MRTVALAALALGGAASAQTSELYINEFLGNNMFVMQGGSLVRSWQTINGNENAIAVYNGEVRTAGSGINGNWTGHQYDPNGGWLGGTYTVSPQSGNYYDGATDGKYNYAVQHNGAYGVFRFDRDWSNGQQIFAVDFPDSGITYDGSDNTLWVSHAFSPSIHHFDMNGAPLGTINLQGSYAYSLALDPADGTLWTADFGTSTLRQYKKDGTLLNTVTVPGMSYGMGLEFDVGRVPAPGAAALFGLGGLVGARRRRRRR